MSDEVLVKHLTKAGWGDFSPDDFLGVAFARQQGHDSVARSKPVTERLFDFAGAFQAGDSRIDPFRWRIESTPLHQIGTVQPCGPNSNRYFAGLRNRVVEFLNPHVRRLSSGLNHDRFHEGMIAFAGIHGHRNSGAPGVPGFRGSEFRVR